MKPQVEWCEEHQRHEPIPSCEPEWDETDRPEWAPGRLPSRTAETIEILGLPGEEVQRYPGELYG